MSGKLLPFSISFEALSILLILEGGARFYLLPFAFLFHLIASAILALIVFPLLPALYKKHPLRSIVLLIAISFFTFPVGYMATLLLALYFFRYGKNIFIKTEEYLVVEDFLHSDFYFPGRFFGEAGVPGIIKDKKVHKALREQAFSVLTNIKVPAVYSLVKESINTVDGDLRLFAFSLLYRTEKRITERMHDLKKKLEENLSPKEKARVYAQLAQAYYDTVLFNLVDKEFVKETLYTARDYALKSIEIEEDDHVHLLLGKIYVKLRQWEKAIMHLSKAYSNLHIKQRTIPYMAECYYYMGNYEKVKELFKELSFTTDVRVKYCRDLWVGEDARAS